MKEDFKAVSGEEFFITRQSHHRKSRLPEGLSFFMFVCVLQCSPFVL